MYNVIVTANFRPEITDFLTSTVWYDCCLEGDGPILNRTVVDLRTELCWWKGCVRLRGSSQLGF